MRSSFAARGYLTAVALAAAAVLCVLCFSVSSADAASPSRTVSGNATFVLGNGPAAKALKKGKVRFSTTGAAKGKAGKRLRAKAPVAQLSVGSRSIAALRGGIRIKAGKRKVNLRGLKLTVGPKRTVVKGKLGKKTIKLFNAAGKSVVSGDAANSVVRVKNARLSLTKPAAKRIRKALKLKRLPARKVGNFAFFGKVTTSGPVDPPVDPMVDPYLAQCNVPATSKVAGTLPVATALPTLTGAVDSTGPANFEWGVKQSFRSYVLSPGSGGSLHALDGATRVDNTPGAGFVFPQGASQYTTNGTETLVDDQAVINGTGTAVFCGTKHDFRVAFSNPTIVIDGDNSRIIADVDSNLAGVWTPSQRVDLAKLDLGPAVQTADGAASNVTWENLAATFTETGAQAACGIGVDARCPYVEGTEMDPITAAVDVPVTLENATYTAQCGVPTGSKTSGTKPAASPLPVLQDAVDTVAPTQVTWGFKLSFRGYLFGTPGNANPFIPLDGATREPGMAPTRGFSFPVSEGEYSANDPVDTSDDQAVINGTGTAVFCNQPHGFWAAISNPTIVIDGANSRIVADIESNEYGPSQDGPWTTRQRVDLADLDVSGITPVISGSTVDWGAVPATLSSEAAPFATYGADEVLDAINVSVETAE